MSCQKYSYTAVMSHWLLVLCRRTHRARRSCSPPAGRCPSSRSSASTSSQVRYDHLLLSIRLPHAHPTHAHACDMRCGVGMHCGKADACAF